MSNTALENATVLRESLAAAINHAQKQIDGWRKELTKVEEFIVAWHAFAGATMPCIPTHALHSKPKRPRHNSRKEEVAEAARAILNEQGRPMMRAELFKAVREKGLVIDGSDPEMVFSTMMWRMRDRVTRLKGGGYWLPEVPNAEASV